METRNPERVEWTTAVEKQGTDGLDGLRCRRNGWPSTRYCGQFYRSQQHHRPEGSTKERTDGRRWKTMMDYVASSCFRADTIRRSWRRCRWRVIESVEQLMPWLQQLLPHCSAWHCIANCIRRHPASKPLSKKMQLWPMIIPNAQLLNLTLWRPLMPHGYSYEASCARPG